MLAYPSESWYFIDSLNSSSSTSADNPFLKSNWVFIKGTDSGLGDPDASESPPSQFSAAIWIFLQLIINKSDQTFPMISITEDHTLVDKPSHHLWLGWGTC